MSSVRTLLSIPSFAGLSVAVLEDLQLVWGEHQYKAGQTVFAQEDGSKDVMFLLEGGLLALFWTEDGREVVFTRFPVGSCIGELSALDNHPRSLAVIAKSQARIIRMEQASFLKLMDQVPEFRQRVILDLVARIRDLTDRTLELTTYSIEQRVCAYLIRLAAESDRLVAGAVLTGTPTHAEIASTIGANREMVSRTMTRLAKRGAIKGGRQRIEILDPEMLSQDL